MPAYRCRGLSPATEDGNPIFRTHSFGLGFINKLRPVSYFRNNDESKKTEYGFIAQEVEEVLKETGTENTGMITID